MHRREFLHLALSVVLAELATESRALAESRSVEDCLAALEDAFKGLRRETLTAAQWHARAGEVQAELVKMPLAQHIDLEELKKKQHLPQARFGARRIKVPRAEGRWGFDAFLMGFRTGTAIPPHGHEGVAALMHVLQGELRATHYDKLESSARRLVVKERFKKTLGPSDATWISDAEANVHTFSATKESWAIDLALYPRSARKKPSSALLFIDLERAKSRKDGALSARVITAGEANRRFGKVR